MGRAGQSLFSEDELRIQMYVDDPAVGILGTEQQARRLGVTLLLWWSALGASLSWAKTHFGTQAKWIGAQINVAIKGVVQLSIPDAYIEKMLFECDALLELKVVQYKRLQKFVGKTGWAAGLIPIIGTFTACLWAAMSECTRHATSKRDLPRDVRRWLRYRKGSVREVVIPLARIFNALSWLRALFQRRFDALQRSFYVPLRPKTKP